MDRVELGGSIVMKEDALYSEGVLGFNLEFVREPKIINFCFNEDDVIKAIKYARDNNLEFRARSGRHDFEVNSNVDNGIVIDISNINHVFIDEDKKIAEVGGGIFSGKMYEVLAERGYTIPSGTCGGVGFCGLTTSGGVGFATRMLGLSCDNLIEVDIINYEGKKITASSENNKDLLWALKGGLALNFGIVTALRYKITKVESAAICNITWDHKHFVDLMEFWQGFAPKTDRRLTIDLLLSKNEEGNIRLASSGQFFGTKEELKDAIRELIKVAEPITLTIEEMPYGQVMEKWSNGCSGASRFKSSGGFIYKPMSRRELEYLYNEMKASAKGKVQFLEFMAMGGAVLDTHLSKAAFAHRDALYLIQIKSVWDNDQEREGNLKWARDMKKFLNQVGRGNYRGFTDFDLKDWQYQYYGDSYEKLREIKSKYDPENIFKFPHSIEIL